MNYRCHAINYIPMIYFIFIYYFITDKLILRGLHCPFAVSILIEKNCAEFYP